jgi:hypothetical protein
MEQQFPQDKPNNGIDDNNIEVNLKGGRIKHFPEAANSEEYIEKVDLRKGAKSIKEPEIREWLLSILSYDDYRFLLHLIKSNLIIFENGEPHINIKEFSGKRMVDLKIPNVGPYSEQNFVACLLRNSVKGISSVEEFSAMRGPQFSGDRSGIQSFVSLPNDLDGLIGGISGERKVGGSGRSGESENSKIGWYDKVVLNDGTVTNPFEIVFAQKLKSSGAYRKGEKLYIKDKDGKENEVTIVKLWKNYSRKGEYVKAYAGHLPEGKNSSEVYYLYLKNLTRQGLVREKDFSVVVRSDASPRIIFKERSGKTPDFSLNVPSLFCQYYIGRDKYSHNGKPIPKGTQFAAIDQLTGGVFEDDHGTMRLVYTFPLITKDEYQTKKEEAIAKVAPRFISSGKKLKSASWLPYIRKSIKKDEVRDYSVTDYVSPYANESKREYGKRLESLGNSEAVVNTINEIFLPANINHFDFSWGQKLRIYEAVRKLEKKDIINFALKYGSQGLRVMIASEADPNWPEEVIRYSSSANEEDARKLFEAYGGILIDESQFSSVLRDTTNVDSEVFDYVADIRKKSLEDVISGMRRAMKDGGQIERLAELAHDGLISKLGVIRALKSEGLLKSVGDIKEFESRVSGVNEISEEEFQQMRSMYASNYETTSGLQKRLLSDFDNAVSGDKRDFQKFFLLKQNGTLQGFFRLEKQDDTHTYFGSFNVNPNLQGYKLGETFLQEVLDSESRDKIISADCDRNSKVSSFYIKNGFVAVGAYDFEEVKALKIVRNDHLKEQLFKTASLTQSEIKLKAKIGESVEDEEGVVISAYKVSEIDHIPFKLIEGSNEDGYVMTKFSRGMEGEDEVVYAVFEKVGKQKLNEFMTSFSENEDQSE